MRNEFTEVIERDGEWYIAYCPEIPGANGQGMSIDDCRASLAEAIELVLQAPHSRLKNAWAPAFQRKDWQTCWGFFTGLREA